MRGQCALEIVNGCEAHILVNLSVNWRRVSSSYCSIRQGYCERYTSAWGLGDAAGYALGVVSGRPEPRHWGDLDGPQAAPDLPNAIIIEAQVPNNSTVHQYLLRSYKDGTISARSSSAFLRRS